MTDHKAAGTQQHARRRNAAGSHAAAIALLELRVLCEQAFDAAGTAGGISAAQRVWLEGEEVHRKVKKKKKRGKDAQDAVHGGRRRIRCDRRAEGWLVKQALILPVCCWEKCRG